MGDCVFCKIIGGEIKGEKILESKNFIILKDSFPRVEGHSLVIPKNHYETFLDLPSILYDEFIDTVRKGTEKLIKETGALGYNLVMNNKKVAGQVVPHLHLHILPRKKNDGYR